SSFVERLDFLVTVVAAAENDRFPLITLEALVDALRFALYFGQKILVALYVRPAGRTELHEREFVSVVRVLVEEAFDAAEALDEALRIVHAIDAHPQENSFRTE